MSEDRYAAEREYARQLILWLRKAIWFLRDTPMQKKLRRLKKASR
jgi:hypothetical protein